MSYQPLGLMASEKIFVWLSHCKYMRAKVPWGRSILNPRGIIKHNCILKGSNLVFSEKKISCVSYYKTMADTDAPWAWPYRPTGHS